jgi:hypothetical protein
MELKELVGLHKLDAVDYFTEEVVPYEGAEYFDTANCIVFRFDGVAYRAIENPSDGYRSSMEKIDVLPNAIMKNVFPSIEVFCRYLDEGTYGESSDLLIVHDLINSKVVLEVGTKNSSDYYPSFVANFRPENMAINEEPPIASGVDRTTSGSIGQP